MRIFACMASSLDGKIGPANVDRFVSITSPYDMEHLKSLRDEADGILFGAGTFRTWPKVHRGHDRSKNQHHFIMSHSLNLDPATPLFQTPTVPLTLFTTSKTGSNSFPKHVNVVITPDGTKQLPFIINYIQELGCNGLLVEGGGHILRQFLDAHLLQELFLTVAPTIMGQPEAPELLSGPALSVPPKIQVKTSELVEDELYLHLLLTYPQPTQSSS